MKRVMLEIQHAVNNICPRGVGLYAANLVKELLLGRAFDYSLSFFQCGREEIDRMEQAVKLYGKTPKYMCNTLNYSDALRKDEVFEHLSYEDYVGGTAELIHFMNIISIPTRIQGRMVVTIHDLNWLYHDEACSPAIRELVKIGWRRVKEMKPVLIAVSESTRREVLENSNLKEDQVFVVHSGYDRGTMYHENDPARLRELGIDGPYIFFVGVFERKKNIIKIVEMFDLVAKKYRDLHLVLAGRPTWDDPTAIYESIRSSPYRERILLPGYVSEVDKRILFSGALCLVFPSVCEGFGTPLVESFACGCPVICSDIPAFREVADGAALMAKQCSAEELAAYVEQLIENETLRANLIKMGKRRADAFSWQKTARATEEIYSKLLEGE